MDCISLSQALLRKSALRDQRGKPCAVQAPKDARVISAEGKYVMPGGIDPHTHLYFLMNGRTGVDDFYR